MDVVTFGETMVLFTPETTGAMRYAHQYSRKFGGSESNFAIGLSRLGHHTGWISRVGNDEFGKAMLSFIRGEGVDVSQVQRDEEAPTGIYFKEIVNAENIRVYYYRKGSAASRMNPADINEEYIRQAKYLFISGITPALSEDCYQMTKQAISIARKYSVQVVFDPNVRRKLWSEEKAKRVLLELAALSDMVLLGLQEAEFLFEEQDPERLGRSVLEHGAALAVLKLGEKGAYYSSKDEGQFVSAFPVKQVIDPVGAGDGFNAGVISGLLDGLPTDQAVQRGNAVGALVTMVNGDVEGLPEKEDVEALIKGSNVDDVAR